MYLLKKHSMSRRTHTQTDRCHGHRWEINSEENS